MLDQLPTDMLDLLSPDLAPIDEVKLSNYELPTVLLPTELLNLPPPDLVPIGEDIVSQDVYDKHWGYIGKDENSGKNFDNPFVTS